MEDSETDEPILPGLPDDIALMCLARVPRLHFPALAGVSRGWKKLLQSKLFYQTRNEAGTLEEHIYVFMESLTDPYDFGWQVFSPSQSRWGRLPPMPGQVRTKFGYAVTCQRLLVIGGVTATGSPSADTFMYDSALNRWSKLASMKGPRYGFACAVVEGLVYVVGGQSVDQEHLSSVEVYDSQADEWKSTAVPDLQRARWGCFACCLQGKLYVLGGRSNYSIGSSRYIDVYDPSTGEWQQLKSLCFIALSYATVQGRLFCVEWRDERTLLVFGGSSSTKQEQCEWSKLRLPLSSNLTCTRPCLGSLDGKLLLFSPTHDTLVYDPCAKPGHSQQQEQQWQVVSGIKPPGACLCCVSIAA